MQIKSNSRTMDSDRQRCTWLTDEEYEATQRRLREIDSDLEGLGATREYCLGYFRQAGGYCHRTVCGQCVEHRCCPGLLPPGKMCSAEFGRVALMLKQKIAKVEEERLAMRREWDRLKQDKRVRQKKYDFLHISLMP